MHRFTFATVFGLVTLLLPAAVLISEPSIASASRQPLSLLRRADAELDSGITKENATIYDRTAARLRLRLARNKIPSPSVGVLSTALKEKSEILKKSVLVHLTYEGSHATHDWVLSPKNAAYILKPEFTTSSAQFVLDEDRLKLYLSLTDVPGMRRPEHATLQEMILRDDVSRVGTTGVAKSGYAFNLETAVPRLLTALQLNEPNASLTLSTAPGMLKNASGYDLGELTLLATGKSNYAGSPYGRIMNVRKAVKDHVNNVLVAPGEVFSFNETLGGAISPRNGWYMAKVIVRGGDLEMAPGGGICQTSTTVYRALVNAGLPVLERRNHTLYVTYYEKYGVGIDATIFPGSQDLTFLNDTGNYLVIQAYEEGTDVVVNIYGTPDGRSATVEGPFFSINAPADLLVNGKPLRSNAIAWKQTIRFANGTEQQNIIVSQYNTLPRSLAAKYVVAAQ